MRHARVLKRALPRAAPNAKLGAMNPIFKREFFARWRDWRSHALLLVLALALSIGAFAVYWTVSFDLSQIAAGTPVSVFNPMTGGYNAPETIVTRTARAGRELFQSLTISNVAVFFFLAPLLTATGIVRERERGLLESLQLSRMSSWAQIRARALSALVFLGALQTATLPIVFVAFSFGGISLPDVGRAFFLVAATALLGVGLGIAISASAARPSGALFSVVALLAVWSGLAGYGNAGANSPYGLWDLGSDTIPLALALFDAHPIALTSRLLDPSMIKAQTISITGSTVVKSVFWTPTQALPFALVVWTLVGALGLWKASRDVTRAFAPAGWAGRNTLVERWKKKREARLENRRARAGASVEGALLADLPFDKWVHFKNPLLNREVKSRFRLRRGSIVIWAGRAVIFVAIVSAWVAGAFSLFDALARKSGSEGILFMEWLLGIVLVGTFAAGEFARERESGTWEGVRLSLMSGREIARTKWLSPLVSYALLSCPLWLLLFGYLPIGSWEGTPARLMFGFALVIAASLALVSAIATWVSLRARNTTTATCWTLGILLFLLVGAPALWQGFDVPTWITTKVVGIPYWSARNGYARAEGSEGCAEDADCRALYESETGHTFRVPVADPPPSSLPIPTSPPVAGPPAGGPPPAVRNASSKASDAEFALFNDWFEGKQSQAKLIHALSIVWHPMVIFEADRNVTNYDDARRDKHRDKNTFVLFALAHAAFCAVCCAFLLGLITRQLNRQRD